MKTKLIFPPFWTCSAPYLSIPSLAAYLKANNKDVEQIDLNLEFMDRMMSKEFLSFCLSKLRNDSIKSSQPEIAPYISELGDFICAGIDEQKDILRSEMALDIEIYEKCCYYIAMGFSIINATFADEKVDHYYYESPYDRKSFKSILTSAKDAYLGAKDSLVSMLTSSFIPRIVHDADLIGISLTGLNQIIPTFILAGLIKRADPKIKIVLGGSVPTRWFACHERAPDIFEYIDYVILNEGEVPLVALINHLEGNNSIENVPQLVYKDHSGLIKYNNLPITSPDICSLPTPVFNKEDIGRYFSPIPTLPLLGCRGCYWCKCTFCDHSFVYNNSYRPANTEKVITDIKNYIKEYNIKYINFHDEAMTPDGLLKLSESLIHNGINIHWSTDARLDRGLTHEILQKAHIAGLSVLFFGLESINKRVVGLMKKGTHIDVTKRILSDATSIGIGVHCFFICGFPTETIEEYKETVNFIRENRDIIASHGCSIFSLGRYSPIAMEPEKYSLRITNEVDIDSASLDFDFLRLDINKTYEAERDIEYTAATKINTYAQKVLSLLFREHWIIFWGDIRNTIQKADAIAKKQPIKSGVFLIDSEDALLVFDCATSDIFEFDKSAKSIFMLIDKYGSNSIDEIACEAAEQFCVSKEDATESIVKFIALLKEKKLIYLPIE